MMTTRRETPVLPGWQRSFGQLREFFELCKPRVVALIIFTAMAGMFLAAPGMVPWTVLVFGTIGIGLAASSAASINHLLDQAADSEMARTRARPLPTGQLTSRQALVFALVLGTVSMIVLVVWVNVLTAVLTAAALIGYGVIYTVYLKYATPQNIVIGGAAGAAPPVLGWVAVTGHVTADALLLFLIIFAWTPPHFWALALYRQPEYARVRIPMLPVTHGSEFTRLHILLYTLLLSAVTILPFATGMSGWFYLAGVLVLDAGFLRLAWGLYRHYSDALARRTFFYSIEYLSVLFVLLLVDHYRTYIGHLLHLATA